MRDLTKWFTLLNMLEYDSPFEGGPSSEDQGQHEGDQAEKPEAGCVPKATYGSMPIGSGRFRNHAQDFYRVLGMTFSSTCALREEDCEAQTALRSSVDHR